MELTSHGVVALVERNGKYLLLCDNREPMMGKWAPPHGRCVEEDGTEENGVIREVEEETGLSIKPIRKVWTVPADTKVKTVSFWEVRMVGDETIRLDLSESSEHGWFTPEEALGLDLYPGTRDFFERRIKGEIDKI